MLPQTGNVARYGVLSHFSRLIHRSTVSNAPRQRRNYRGISALWFGAEHDVVAESGFRCDEAILSC